MGEAQITFLDHTFSLRAAKIHKTPGFYARYLLLVGFLSSQKAAPRALPPISSSSKRSRENQDKRGTSKRGGKQQAFLFLMKIFCFPGEIAAASERSAEWSVGWRLAPQPNPALRTRNPSGKGFCGLQGMRKRCDELTGLPGAVVPPRWVTNPIAVCNPNATKGREDLFSTVPWFLLLFCVPFFMRGRREEVRCKTSSDISSNSRAAGGRLNHGEHGKQFLQW